MLRIRRPLLLLLVLPALVLGTPRGVRAQPVVEVVPDSVVQEMTLRDGSRVYGRIVDAGDPAIFRLVSGGEISVPRLSITGLRVVSGTVRDGEYWGEDPNATRLFFGPTGRTLEAESGYVSVFQLVVPFLAFAPTDDVILAAGTPLVFGDDGDRIVWLAPKVRVASQPGFDASLGVLAFFGGGGASGTAGILYGVASFGDPDGAFTAGLGWGYLDDDLADRPVVMFGGERRVARGLKLMSENYLFPEGDGLFSGGVRFFGERLSADLGLLVPNFGAELVALPLVNFVWNW